MDYTSICLPQIFSIDRIYSIHYFEYMSNFHFTGESHDFWEFLYVDKGEVLVTSQDQELFQIGGDHLKGTGQDLVFLEQLVLIGIVKGRSKAVSRFC